MIEATLHMTFIALEVYLLVLFVLGKRSLSITHAVAFDIGFGAKVDAVLVAQLIPIGIVGIMAGTYGVDVHLLHLLDVLQHALTTDDVASVGIHLMTIHTLDEDGFAVDHKLGIA